MSKLKANLANAAERRLARKTQRSNVLKTIVEISEERAKKAPDLNLAGSASPVAGLPAGHSMDDGHNHGSTGGGFDPNFQTNLQRLLKDFGGKVSVSSGYRSPERQAVLWQNALRKYGDPRIARRWVAPPGKSNHGRGLAADLKFNGISPEAVHRAAGRYGLHFPLSNENWHIEPISARKKK